MEEREVEGYEKQLKDRRRIERKRGREEEKKEDVEGEKDK